MTKCKNCNVFVDSQHNKCPLCLRKLENSGESITLYPEYQKTYYQMKDFTFQKLFLFLMIAVVVISITSNALTLKTNPDFWSPIVSTAALYFWITFRNTVVSKMNLGGKILIQFLSISVLLFIIDIFTGFSKWSTTYMMPFLTIALTFLITIIAITKKARWQDYMGYLLVTLFINLCPVILFVCSLSTVVWTSVTAIVYSLLTFIGLLIFSDRKFKEEMKKRFHF